MTIKEIEEIEKAFYKLLWESPCSSLKIKSEPIIEKNNEIEVLKLRLESLEKKYNNEIMINLYLSRLLDSYRSDQLPITHP